MYLSSEKYWFFAVVWVSVRGQQSDPLVFRDLEIQLVHMLHIYVYEL